MAARISIILVLLGVGSMADTLTYTSQSYGGPPTQSCGNFQACQPYYMAFPQFDPQLGTLASATWSFTDYQEYFGGVNDMYDPAVGMPYSWATVEGDEGDGIGLDAQVTQLNVGVATGTGEIGMGGWNYDTVEATGALGDMNQFMGSGWFALTITPFLYASYPQSVDGWPTAALIEVEDEAILTVNYTYSPEVGQLMVADVAVDSVPEPGGDEMVVIVLLLAVSAIVAARKGQVR
jgi:hypothetical protein